MAILCACGGAPPKEQPQAAPAPAAAKPVDESRRFPLADRTSLHLVDDHVLGKDFLPGGNVAEYRRKGKTYQQFLVRSTSAESAALLLFDFKGHLKDAKYLAHMGGYFGHGRRNPGLHVPKGRLSWPDSSGYRKKTPTFWRANSPRGWIKAYSAATRTSCLPVFSPCSIPMKARGAFSIPSTNCSRYFSLAAFNHPAISVSPSA